MKSNSRIELPNKNWSDEHTNYNIKENTIISRFSISEAVVNYFIKEIKEGCIIPGDKFPSERILQKKLRISRFSLREGLARLSALGIIKTIQGKGTYVSEEIDSTSLGNVLLPHLLNPKSQSYEDIFEARLLIEEKVAVLAARRRSDRDLDILHQILEQAEIAIEDASRFGELDYLFHDQLANAAGNAIFKKMLDVINKHLRLFLYDHARDAASRRKALRSHWQIFKCIKNNETTKAGKIIRNHIKGCKRNYEMSHHKKGKSPILRDEVNGLEEVQLPEFHLSRCSHK